jgi:hypothetical protein
VCPTRPAALTRDDREGRAALAALLLTTCFDHDRHPDRELLVRARSALDEAISG